MEEKRKYVRFQAPFCGQYKRIAPISQEYSVVVKDISMGGAKVLVDTEDDICPDSLASISVILPEITIPLSARVVWNKPRGDKKEVGLSFLKIPDSSKEDIYNYIFKYHKSEVTNKWWDF